MGVQGGVAYYYATVYRPSTDDIVLRVQSSPLGASTLTTIMDIPYELYWAGTNSATIFYGVYDDVESAFLFYVFDCPGILRLTLGGAVSMINTNGKLVGSLQRMAYIPDAASEAGFWSDIVFAQQV